MHCFQQIDVGFEHRGKALVFGEEPVTVHGHGVGENDDLVTLGWRGNELAFYGQAVCVFECDAFVGHAVLLGRSDDGLAPGVYDDPRKDVAYGQHSRCQEENE